MDVDWCGWEYELCCITTVLLLSFWFFFVHIWHLITVLYWLSCSLLLLLLVDCRWNIDRWTGHLVERLKSYRQPHNIQRAIYNALATSAYLVFTRIEKRDSSHIVSRKSYLIYLTLNWRFKSFHIFIFISFCVISRLKTQE